MSDETLVSQFPEWPIWGDAERRALLRALDSGAWAGSRAEGIRRFNRAFQMYQGGGDCIGVSNGTVAIEAALIAAGIGEGDEVIVPAITFVATASAVLRVNAVPVVVDVDADTLCIDPRAAAKAMTDRTRAVIAVHVAGGMADVEVLQSLVESRGILLLEDCAHAHGSQWLGRGAGSFGHLGTFSFQHSKLLSAGEGGGDRFSKPDCSRSCMGLR